MWCTSRASPDSTTSPTLVRLRSRTRWWCTAETASSDGIGAIFSSDSRSDRMMIRAPSAIAAEVCARTLSSAAFRPAPFSATGYRQRITLDRMPCRRPLTSTSGSRLISLASSWLRRIGCGKTIWRHESWLGLSRSPSPPDGALQAGHHLFTDGVQRWVGHLREQLLEVVEQHARPLGEHRNRCIGSHRADRLRTGTGHRRHQQVKLLVGVTEDQLPQHDPMVRHPHVVALRQLVQRNQAVVEPLLIRAARRPTRP